MSASADIENFQMNATFLVWGGRPFCEEGRSFEGGVHLGRDTLSDNYGTDIYKNPYKIVERPKLVGKADF